MTCVQFQTASQERTRRAAEEFYEKLGAILNTLDSGLHEMPENDRAALIWAALDYHELLGEVIGTSATKQS